MNDDELVDDPGLYRRLVGKLVYFIITWSDSSYAISVVNQYLTAPWISH